MQFWVISISVWMQEEKWSSQHHSGSHGSKESCGQSVGCCKTAGNLWGSFCCCPPSPGSCPELLHSSRWLYPSTSPAHWHTRHISWIKGLWTALEIILRRKNSDVRGHKRSGLDYCNFISSWAAPGWHKQHPQAESKNTRMLGSLPGGSWWPREPVTDFAFIYARLTPPAICNWPAQVRREIRNIFGKVFKRVISSSSGSCYWQKNKGDKSRKLNIYLLF